VQLCFPREDKCISGPESPELVVLAPSAGAGLAAFDPGRFRHAVADPHGRRDLLAAMQRFRGSIALEEGAAKPEQLTADGRHEMEGDAQAWHLLLRVGQEIVGCMRSVWYRPTVRATDLLVWRGALARSTEWGFSLRAAVEQQLAAARSLGVMFSEPGGWVMAPHFRGTTGAIRLALSGFALAGLLGNAVGVYTATRKHHSAAMLRRLGGTPLAFGGTLLPAYYEPHFDCEIEILRFDTARIQPVFEKTVRQLRQQIARRCTVLTAGAPALGYQAAAPGLREAAR
jgi:hypothetical protein